MLNPSETILRIGKNAKFSNLKLHATIKSNFSQCSLPKKFIIPLIDEDSLHRNKDYSPPILLDLSLFLQKIDFIQIFGNIRPKEAKELNPKLYDLLLQ